MNDLKDSLLLARNLQRGIHKLTWHWRVAHAFMGLVWGVVAGLVALIVVALFSRFIPFWTSADMWRHAFWFPFWGIVEGILTGSLWTLPLPRRLRVFDRTLEIQDSLTTSWEITRGDLVAPTHFIELQLAQTMTRLKNIDIRKSFPLHPDKVSIALIPILCLIIIPLLLLPNPQDAVITRQRLEKLAVSHAIQQIKGTLGSLSSNTNLTPEQREELISVIEQAIVTLEDPQTSFDEKTASLMNAEGQLEQYQYPAAPGMRQRIENIAELAISNNLPDDSIMRDILDALSQQDFEAVARFLNDITASITSDSLTNNEISVLGEALAQLASTLEQTQPESANVLETTAEAAADQVSQITPEMLQQAAQVLRDLAQMQEVDVAVQQAQAAVQQAQYSLRQTVNSLVEQTGSGVSEPVFSFTGTASNESGNTGGFTNGTDGEGRNRGPDITVEQNTERLSAIGGEITLPRPSSDGSPVPVSGNPNESRIPYQEVYTEYAGAAKATLFRRVYPPLLRDLVHDYFSSLED